MSIVFSFRLDPENPREADVLQVIKAWQGKGYSLRDILTRALLDFDKTGGMADKAQVNQVLVILEEIKRTLKSKSGETSLFQNESPDIGSAQELSTGFLTAMKIAVKPGICSES